MVEPLDELKTALATGRTLIVCGAGVSIQATGRKAPGWKALIEAGFTEVSSRILPETAWVKAARAYLDSANADDWLSAADIVQEKLEGSDGGPYKAFLKRQFRTLTASDPGVLESLKQLVEHQNRVSTTNYDDVIRKHLDFDAIPWTRPEAVAECLKGEREGVLHLHGHWDDAPSVIFSKRDYDNMQRQAKAQFMQQLATHNFTLLFIGCSTSGLADENIGKLLSWFQQHWAALATRHFALVRKGEETGAWPQAITPIVYGPKHEDLPSYIASLLPARPLSTDRPFPSEPNMMGRGDAKKALVDKILNGRRPILILGGPGMGKSTLAVAAAHDAAVKARYGTRRVFVNLEPHTTADAMLRACAAALGVSATGALTEILGRLQGGGQQPSLVILDNLETPWYAQQSETEEWIGQLKDVEGLRLVLTHRGGKPAIPGGVEQLDDVKKLELPDVRALFLRDLPETFATDPDLDALLHELDGHPLSIVLLAAQADGRGTLKSLLADWKDKKADLLSSGAGDTRLLSTRISLAISIDRLDRKSRRLFGLAALLPDGLAEQDIGSVLPGAGTDECINLERMRLVTRDQGRLRMLAPFREVTQVDDRPSRPDERRLINHFLTIAISGRAIGTNSWASFAHSIEREAENLDQIISRAASWGDFAPRRLREAVDGLLEYHKFTGKGGVTSGERVIEQLAAAGEVRLRAHCIRSLGDVARRRSDRDGAQRQYEEAMRLYKKVDDVLGQANCIRNLGSVALSRSDLDGAQKLHEEAMRLYKKVHDELGQANCIHRLGDLALRREKMAEAVEHWHSVLAQYVRFADQPGEGFTCVKLARHGPPEHAMRMREQARIAFKGMQRADFIARFVDGDEDTDAEF